MSPHPSVSSLNWPRRKRNRETFFLGIRGIFIKSGTNKPKANITYLNLKFVQHAVASGNLPLNAAISSSYSITTNERKKLVVFMYKGRRPFGKNIASLLKAYERTWNHPFRTFGSKEDKQIVMKDLV
ncbi:hypothetical protein J6590_056000 [Homalodisca vitripennis]|nr:hypothetical protein J6590_056000 [Homalodisca vitripennis]